jgi:NAD-dependent deacetylase
LENAGFTRAVITQNIDGLHRKAGSKNIYEVHGSFETLTCIACYRRFANSQFLTPYIEFGKIPTCPECAHVLKPDIILFEEQLPKRIWLAAQEACRTCDLMIVAGSSLEVLPVAGLPMRALENGAHLILMNNSETYLDVRADVVIYEDVAETLPLIVHEVMDG